jgi:hypothetical protein
MSMWTTARSELAQEDPGLDERALGKPELMMSPYQFPSLDVLVHERHRQ